MPSRSEKVTPQQLAAERRYREMLERDDDAPWGSTDPREAGKINRTIWFAVGGAAVCGVVLAGGLYVAANQKPSTRTESESTAGPVVPSSPSASETSASPSPSKTSASPSPSPSESKTAAPSPTDDPASPSNIPSPSRSTHKVVLPPIETPSTAPETHTSAPEQCAWPSNGGVVTVAECGDHTAYNDPSRSGEHQLGTGMQFEAACSINGMVRVSYGGGQDYLENNGYFPVAAAC